MRSRILIDLDENNNPVIVLDYIPSEDLRDKLVKRFIEGFGYESNHAHVEFTSPRSTFERDLYDYTNEPGSVREKLTFRSVSKETVISQVLEPDELETLRLKKEVEEGDFIIK